MQGATVVKVETCRGRPPPRPLNPPQRVKSQQSECCGVAKVYLPISVTMH